MSSGWTERSTVAVGAGLGLLALCAVGARPGTVPAVEAAVFDRVNQDAGPAERPLWVWMQLGNGLSAVAVPAVLLAGGRPRSDALRAAVAGFGGWQLAKAVKRIVPRGRPAALLDRVTLRDGDPSGGGFVSGHATVSMATAMAVGASLPTATWPALIGAAALVGVARVHVGAHLPLDVVGGAGLGLVWGSICGAVGRDGSAA